MYALSVRVRLQEFFLFSFQFPKAVFLSISKRCFSFKFQTLFFFQIPKAGLTKAQLQATVTRADFDAAAKEVKPSVSMKELEYYHSLRRKFSAEAAVAAGGAGGGGKHSS